VHLHRGQMQAWQSDRRIVLVLAGTQGGKTVFGPLWLYREMQRRGPGDYMVVTPTYPLLELKALPEFRRLFEDALRLGSYKASPSRQFVVSDDGARRLFGRVPDQPTRVVFGYAGEPESLESATVKGVWIDEAGQRRFKQASWEAILRRAAIYQARILITTTPYTLSWLKTDVYDRWVQGDPNIGVVRFASIDNPTFPREEYERARAVLPRWKFDMFYRAEWSRPAGLIYDCVGEAHYVRPFPIPSSWTRYVGIDFGGVNMAAVYLAVDPDSQCAYVYRTYLHRGYRTIQQHVRAITAGEPAQLIAVGGAESEQQWRNEMATYGLPVKTPPVRDVEVGIQRVYQRFSQYRLLLFDHLDDLERELVQYSRVIDATGEPTEAIEDKHAYHLLDALRYVVAYLDHPRPVRERPTVSYRSFA